MLGCALAACGARPLASSVADAEATWGAMNDADAGLECFSSTDDARTTTVILDGPACVERTPEPCSSTNGTSDRRVEDEVIRRLVGCGLVRDAFVRVEIIGGCPTSFASYYPVRDDVVSCVTAALSLHRWSCAGASECVTYNVGDTLP
jgi:hypothetical protein